MSFKVLVPARYAATRLPGKPLLDVAGQPLIERVYRAALASTAADVIVVTDDERVASCVGALGGKVCSTGAHASGTDRLAEAVERLGESDDAIIVNLQGDEPLMPPSLLTQVAALLEKNPRAEMATLFAPLDTATQIFDPNVVKLVCNAAGKALYFSRAPIPWDRASFAGDRSTDELPMQRALWHRHIGLYAYRVGFLKRFAALGPCPLEEVEMLEQLRALWHGIDILVECAAETPGRGVDTAEDLDYVRRVFESSACTKSSSAAEPVGSQPALSLLTEPEKPAPYECCGRGCERCVFVYYEEAMERWRQAVAVQNLASMAPS
jgi:3-deoxy-manno-octulosonate cytidylyltransferase (CMP-KDO synthetase)